MDFWGLRVGDLKVGRVSGNEGDNVNLILLGAPGAGKGTQAQFITSRTHIPQISTGDILRAARNNKTPLGLAADEYMRQGKLVPDEVVIGIVDERLAESDCAQGFLLDGFPRTVNQADALSVLLAKRGRKIERVLSVDVPEETLLIRLSGRRTCGKCGAGYHVQFARPLKEGTCDKCGGQLIQREDDSEATVRQRLVVYQQQTAPLIDYYQKKNLLTAIDGHQSVEDVRRQIENAIGLGP